MPKDTHPLYGMKNQAGNGSDICVMTQITKRTNYVKRSKDLSCSFPSFLVYLTQIVHILYYQLSLWKLPLSYLHLHKVIYIESFFSKVPYNVYSSSNNTHSLLRRFASQLRLLLAICVSAICWWHIKQTVHMQNSNYLISLSLSWGNDFFPGKRKESEIKE